MIKEFVKNVKINLDFIEVNVSVEGILHLLMGNVKIVHLLVVFLIDVENV